MDRKIFVIMLVVQLVVYSFCLAIKGFQPEIAEIPDISRFPLQKGSWTGQKDNLAPAIVDMLNPTLLFSAAYTNENGISVHLFFDYFAGQHSLAGPHSPRNCMPGSGWIIMDKVNREIMVNGRPVTVGRFDLRMGDSKMLMDFWYITRHGETANDYVFKLYTIISAFTFKTNDVVFVRILVNRDAESAAALEDFETLFVDEIYNYLGF